MAVIKLRQQDFDTLRKFKEAEEEVARAA